MADSLLVSDWGYKVGTEVAVKRRWCARILVLVMLLGACTPASRPDSPRDSESAPNSLACSNNAHVYPEAELPDVWDDVLNVTAFPSPTLGLYREGDVGTPYEGLFFSKIGLPVKVGSEFLLEANASQGTTVLLKWALQDRDHPSSSLRVGPCDGEEGDWLVYAGGMWLEEPSCVTLIVTVEGAEGTSRAAVFFQVGDIYCPMGRLTHWYT